MTAAIKVLDQPLGDLWLHSEEQSLRVFATQSFARPPLGKERLPDLLRSLNDPEPINRVFALKAVQRVTGQATGHACPPFLTLSLSIRIRRGSNRHRFQLGDQEHVQDAECFVQPIHNDGPPSRRMGKKVPVRNIQRPAVSDMNPIRSKGLSLVHGSKLFKGHDRPFIVQRFSGFNL